MRDVSVWWRSSLPLLRARSHFSLPECCEPADLSLSLPASLSLAITAVRQETWLTVCNERTVICTLSHTQQSLSGCKYLTDAVSAVRAKDRRAKEGILQTIMRRVRMRETCTLLHRETSWGSDVCLPVRSDSTRLRARQSFQNAPAGRIRGSAASVCGATLISSASLLSWSHLNRI